MIKIPLSELKTMEPSDKLVLSLWHDLSILDLEDAILTGRDLLHRLSSILRAGVSPELLDETKTYAIFNMRVRSESKDPRIRILDLESGKILYVIIPSIIFTPGDSPVAVVSSATDEFKGPVVEGTWHDVRAFFCWRRAAG